ncbi:MAG TPA: HAMP domain-containing sensor histidine kinase [Nocardioidaceae bacterium]|nr:HAMP domain-containing sensor histidine kinase [Nocardioidaceae bacterium]
MKPFDRRRAAGRRRGGPGFAGRLLVAQALVLFAGALTAWVVATAVGPRIFRTHVGMAGVAHTAGETEHVNEAFASALLISLAVALLTSVVLALAVTWYFTRRTERSIALVTNSATEIAHGNYALRIPTPALGREFDTLAETFNELAQRLDMVETIRRRMLGDLAHEMRTPLATLDAHLEALEDGVRELDQPTLTVLHASSHRLGRLAEDITAVSLAQEGAIEIRPVTASPRQLMAAAVRAARDRYDAKGVNLTSDVSTDAQVNVDPERMAQILGNLLDNALRHTPMGGDVRLTSRIIGTDVAFIVTDTGEGIEQEHAPYLFYRFYRVDTARSRDRGGSGIGLTVTKALVQAHGGHITAHSDGRGHGAVFTITLPALASQPQTARSQDR